VLLYFSFIAFMQTSLILCAISRSGHINSTMLQHIKIFYKERVGSINVLIVFFYL
jgi:hypothetical protein